MLAKLSSNVTLCSIKTLHKRHTEKKLWTATMRVCSIVSIIHPCDHLDENWNTYSFLHLLTLGATK